MARIVFKPLRSANGTTAQNGEIYFDTATKQLSYKDENGNIIPAGGGGANALIINGDALGAFAIDAQNNMTLSLSFPDISGLTPGQYSKVVVDSKGRVTSGSALVAADIPALDWSKISSGKPTTLAGYGITDAATSNHTHAVATTSAAGLMSAADKSKLDGISGSGATYSVATTSTDGLMSAADKTKLNGLSSAVATTATNGLMSSTDKSKLDGLTTYSLATTVSAGLMSAADKSKLDGISAGSTGGGTTGSDFEFNVVFSGSNPGSVQNLPTGWSASINGTDVTITHTAGKALKSIHYWGYSASAGVENYRLPSSSVPATIPYADRTTKFTFRITTSVAGADVDSNARVVVSF